MKEDRKILEANLEKVFNILYKENELARIVSRELFKKHNVPLEYTHDLVQNKSDIVEASKEVLVWLSYELSKQLKVYRAKDGEENGKYHEYCKTIDPYRFFDEDELKMLNKKLPKNENSKFPIKFEKVLQVADDQWVAVVDVDFIKDLRDKQIIKYNKNTQRQITLKKIKESVVWKITVFTKAIKEITSSMKSGDFIPNAISLNINADKPSNFHFTSDGGMVIQEGTIDIIDGFHRYLSMTNAKDDNSNFEYRTIVNIMNFTEEKAQRYIVQEDKKNKINKDYIKSIDNSDRGNAVVKYLNETSTSYLYRMISNQNEVGKISFATLSSAISNSFELNPTELPIINKYLLKTMNSIIEQDTSVIQGDINNMLFVAYIRIASKHYNTKDEKMILNDASIVRKKLTPDVLKALKSGSSNVKIAIKKIDKIIAEGKYDVQPRDKRTFL